MRLKEQLRQNLTGHLSDEKTEVDVNIAAKIAEDFAISFAEWICEKADVPYIKGTMGNTLEIFKKES
jgi:hypothetical protein